MTETNTIGPYRILEPLGRGGMGIVYRARHISSERAIALKTVKVPAPRWLDSIRREVQALTRIRHPGVVRIVDHGVQQGRPWYAMDLVEGESLRRFGQRIWSPYRALSTSVPSTEEVSKTEGVSAHWADTLREGAEPGATPAARPEGIVPAAAGELASVLQIMRRLCATLAFLHGEGFINGDLKPENVLLVGDQPVIIDFGLTAHHPGGTGREALEAQRGMSGTLPYMSPEQIRGEFLDARSDLYSVGCMLYELVTGAPPFTGAPRIVMRQHLSERPIPPSQLVSGVPPELESLMLTLLEKELTERYGYADEVAAVLAEVSRDARRLSDFPPARSYLYRPRFVGREALVHELTQLRERAINGAGSLVLIGGESGVGKTRLAMELTRIVPSTRMRVVTSEASALAAESAAAVGPAPLHALRSLLQAVADRCQEGGPEATERLLGDRRSVLALYEPALAQVPRTGSPAPPIPLGAEASRQRLFKYLSETLGCYAQEKPLLWLLDDLGWADELSLAFLRSLTVEFLEAHPIFILGTYRTEEPSEGIAAVAELPHVTHLTLPRLGETAVYSMIGDMLALRESLGGFTEFVARQAEGNPFFVAEYLRTAVAERVVYRDQQHSWQLLDQTHEYESLLLPHSLLALIEQRLRKLGPAAHRVGLAAAVLGREADLDTLLEVAGLSEEAFVSAVDDLMRRQVLEQPVPGSVRFAHDKLREVTYTQAPAKQLRELHGGAATALETRWRDRPDASSQWATLGHHFAAAQDAERAAHYLKLAADHARQTHANGDAIRLYQAASKQVSQILLQLESDPASWNDTLVELLEALADVQSLTAQRDEARAAYDQAFGRTPDDRSVARARLCRKLGKTWETQHQHVTALKYYGLARDVLDADPMQASPEERDEWIQVHIDQLWVYYWLDRVPEMDAIIRELRPLVEKLGSPTQRIRYFQSQLQLNLRRDRYVVTEETLGFAKAAVDACQGNAAPAELPMAQFNYGFALHFHNSLDRADAVLKAALALAQRAGDTAHQARCLTYLTLTARRRNRLAEATEYTARSLAVSTSAGMRDYVAAARANQAWLAVKRGDLEAASGHAQAALQIWKSLALVFPLQWTALVPMLQVALDRDRLEDAVGFAQALLDPTQQFLPGAAADALARAGKCWNVADQHGARRALRVALGELEPLGHT